MWLILFLLVPGPSQSLPIAASHASQTLPIISSWYQSKKIIPPRPDPDLMDVALLNSRALMELPKVSSQDSMAFLKFHLMRKQIGDANLYPFALRLSRHLSPDNNLRSFLDKNATQNSFTHYGWGIVRTPKETIMTFIFVRRRLEITQLTHLKARSLKVCGRLLSGSNPQLFLTTPDHQIIRRNLSMRQSRFCTETPLKTSGKYQLEIMVEGPSGPEVAFLLPIYSKISPPPIPSHKVYPDQELLDEHRTAELLFALINQSRRQMHLKPVLLLPALTVVAQRHSREMMERGTFGHRSLQYGDLSKRLSHLSNRFTIAEEALALASSPWSAHDSLLDSPSHRATLLSPALTHVGIGVATDKSQQLLYITECFIQEVKPESGSDEMDQPVFD